MPRSSSICWRAAGKPMTKALTPALSGTMGEGAAEARCRQGVSAAHRFPVRVYYEDTDAAGIVYYANYLKFAERARSEWLREIGDDEAKALRASGLLFVVRRCAIDYRQAARLDDLLEVETRVTGFAGATLDLEQTVRRAGVDLVAMKITLACVNSAGRPARLPPTLRAALAIRLPA
jgi:acyl-CoA thioester hydrolase